MALAISNCNPKLDFGRIPVMRQPSQKRSRISQSVAAVALLAVLVSGTFYFAPRVWKHAAKNAPVAKSITVSAPPLAIHRNAPTQAPPIVAVKPAPLLSRKPAPEETKSAALSADLHQIPVSPKSNNLSTLEANKQKLGKDEFRMQADTGSTGGSGETGEDPKLRANYFYRQRAYPFEQTPAGALQQSRQQLDAMITQQRAMGILPEEGAPTSAVGFPGPANWTNLGPQPVTNGLGGQNFGNPAATGRVTAIAVDPTTTSPASQIVYLGAATGGVWRSLDGGTTWNTIFDQNNSLAIGGIAIAPTDHNTIYVGTGELNFSLDSYYGAGIYKSTNGGNTWTQQCGPAGEFCNPIGSFPFQGGGFIVGRIAVSPASASIALAAVRDAGNGSLSGIYRTTDGGTTWALVPTAAGSAGDSIVWNPADSTVVYATLGQTGANAGVFKSTDGGATFTKLTGSLPNLPTTNIGRHELALAPSNPNVIYVAIDNNDPASPTLNSLLGLAKSTDAGATWKFTSPGTLPALPDFCHNQCWYDMALAVHPTDPNTVVVGGAAITSSFSSTDFRSSDGGTTWVDITSGSTAVRPHVDTHVLTFASTGGGNFRLYTGNDGGIWFTDNPTTATVTWQPGNNANLTITQFYPGHAVHPSDENISFGGTQDNGTEKYSGVLAWDHVACGDGAWAAIDPNIPTIVYANCQNIALQRSLSDGVAGSFTGITNQIPPPPGERSLFIPPLVQDRNQSGRLYFGTFRVWQSMDYGNNWSAISPDLTSNSGNEVTSVMASRANNNDVYATTTDGRVWRTTSASTGTGAIGTWTNLTKAPLPGRYATMVITDDVSPDIAYVSYSGFSGFVDSVGHIFKTTDGGTTWTDISGNLPNTPVNDIVYVDIQTLSFTALFVATDVGVFECSNPTAVTPCATWTPVGTGLPKVPVVGLAYRENSATLRAVTHGRGVWEMETPGVDASGLLLLTSITPSSRPLNSGSFTMTFDGNDFGLPSGTPTILVDGADPGVSGITFTANHMTATIPANVTATPGAHQIRIMQLGHASTPNNPTDKLIFSVPGPAPTLTQISPNQVAIGAPGFTMTLTGTNFVCSGFPSNSIVEFGSNRINTSTCSATSLTINVPSNLLTSTAAFSVKAFNPGPGGGNSGALTFTIGSPDMTITKSHSGNFALGQTGATYTITATNSGSSSTSGTVTVVDTLPAGLTATAIAGTGWTCTLGTLTCTRADVLAAASSYPAITLTVTVGTTAGNVTNTATVSGGGESVTTNDTASDLTVLVQDFAVSAPATPVTVIAGQTATYTITVTPGPGGFPNAVTFSASGLPAAATATFNPPSVTPGSSVATTVLSITTTAHSALSPNQHETWKLPQFVLLSFLLATILLGSILFGRTGRQRRFVPAMFATAALLVVIGISGCGSGINVNTGTPAGTSTITVTATSGSIAHTANVTLTVQ
jgi:uncharacterized repeat protein (TIGR01451 family)